MCSRLSIPFVPFYMLCNSRTRSRVLALGNANMARSSCRLPRQWNHVVLHSIEAGSSLPLFSHIIGIPVQLRLSAAVVGHCVMWPRVYHQRKREHTHGILHLRSQARGFFVCTLCATPTTWMTLLSGVSRTSGMWMRESHDFAPCEVSRLT